MMEPVPETERLDDFRPSPLPLLRLHNSSNTSFPTPPTDAIPAATRTSPKGGPTASFATPSKSCPQLLPQPSDPAALNAAIDLAKKPHYVRRSTDPTPSSPQSPSWSGSNFQSSPYCSPSSPSSYSVSTPVLPYRPRTTSPLSYNFSHVRSRSHASSLAPSMSRTQSMPGFNGAGHILYLPQAGSLGRPASPSTSPARPIRARKTPVDEVFPTSPIRQSVLEDRRRGADRSESPAFGTPTQARQRRPSSPPRHSSNGSTSSLPGFPSTPSSITSSPSPRTVDMFASSSSFGSSVSLFPISSIPTTPTSARSRSPSISSLETIPDSPGAEEEAEAELIAQLKEAAEAAERNHETPDIKSARNSLEVAPRGRSLGGFGPARDKRKRWSVCGAERRGDLNLDTIWED